MNRKSLTGILKIAVIVGSAFIVLFLFLQLLLIVWGNNFIKNKIEGQINNDPKSKYRLQIGTLSVNLLLRSITGKNITCTSLKDQKENHSIVDCAAESISIKGIHLVALIKKEIKVSALEINTPDIKLQPVKEKKHNKKRLPPILQKIEIQNIKITNGHFEKTGKDKHEVSFLLNSLNFDNENAIIYPEKLGKGEFIISRKSLINIGKTEVIFHDSLYTFSVGKLSAKFPEQTIQTDKLSLKPNYDKHQFSRVKNKEEDRLAISIETVLLNKIDLRQLQSGGIIMRSAVLKNFQIEDYLDTRVPPQPHAIDLPQRLLMKAGCAVAIDSIKCNEGKVIYQEQRKDRSTYGELSFNNINGVFTNVTNDKKRLEKKHTCDLQAEGNLMGKGKIKLNLSFFLLDSKDKYIYTSTLSAMDASVFNSFIEKTLPARIKSGNIKSVELSAEADNQTSMGNMHILYDNFTIEILKENHQSFEQKIFTFLAQKGVLIRENPHNNKTRPGEIKYERHPEDTIFISLWKSVLSGLISTITHKELILKKIVKV